jgi:F-box and WD-40 domain protein CDC4
LHALPACKFRVETTLGTTKAPAILLMAMEYPSDTSSTATAAPPSPDTSHREKDISSGLANAPYVGQLQSPSLQHAVMGQLSYAPATQTTVITTTTTTTTAFPPFLVHAPRDLAERDPKHYPLAASPTPSGIKRFTLQLAGRPAIYEEMGNVETGLLEVLSEP